MRPLAQAYWPQLKRLDLSYNYIGSEAIQSLVACKLPLLEWLSLDHNWLEHEDAGHALAEGNWPMLKQLILS